MLHWVFSLVALQYLWRLSSLPNLLSDRGYGSMGCTCVSLLPLMVQQRASLSSRHCALALFLPLATANIHLPLTPQPALASSPCSSHCMPFTWSLQPLYEPLAFNLSVFQAAFHLNYVAHMPSQYQFGYTSYVHLCNSHTYEINLILGLQPMINFIIN